MSIQLRRSEWSFIKQQFIFFNKNVRSTKLHTEQHLLYNKQNKYIFPNEIK